MTLAAALTLAGCSRATLAQFEQTLAAHDSATVALSRWCAARGIASPATIRAEVVKEAVPRQPVPEARRLLDPAPDETLSFRHVRLWCGKIMLSEAWNWYLPDRLPAEVTHQLARSDVPFGRALAPWHFTRRRLETTYGDAPDCPPRTILAHRAVLDLPGAGPVSYVIECYMPEAVKGV